MPNSRLCERAHFFGEVDVLVAGAVAPRRVWGTDISETGIFLQTTHPFRPGDRVSLRFDVEHDEVHVPAAEVMWVRRFEPIAVDGKLPGVGIRFVAVEARERAKIRSYVKHDDEPLEGNATIPETPADEFPSLHPSMYSLPPVSQRILSMNASMSSLPEGTSLPPISLLPFTQPPHALNISEPPHAVLPGPHEEHHGTTPRAVTLTPQENPLAGWRFAPDDMPGPFAADEPETTDPNSASNDAAATAGAFTPGIENHFFDDIDVSERHAVAEQDIVGEPTLPPNYIASLPPEAVARDDDDDRFTPLPQRLDGDLAIRSLPIAEERRLHKKRGRFPVLPTAVGLLGAAAVVGALRMATAEPVRDDHVEIVAAPRAESVAKPAPQAPVVNEAAKPLGENLEGAPQPVEVAEAPLKKPAALGDVVITARAAETQAAPPVDVDDGVPIEPRAKQPEGAALEDKLEVKGEAAAEAKAEAAAVGNEKATEAAAKVPDDANAMVVERNRVLLPLPGGKVQRTFTLANPSRVVVDLADAPFAGAKMERVNRRGVTRVRVGKQEAGHVRVVVELARPEKPFRAKAEWQGDRLQIAWK